jgi:tRNA (mo5U34)-methyltransferase
MDVKLARDGFEVGWTWSDQEYRSFEQEIQASVSFGYYQRIVVRDRAGRTLETPGSHLTYGVMPLLDAAGFPPDLRGRTVLDIGCNAGFYSVVSHLRGAAHVIGLDLNEHYINQAMLLKRLLRLNASPEFRVGTEQHLEGPATYDFVINTGVIYHLENPMDFLRRIHAVTGDMMLLESEMLTSEAHTEHAWFIEREYGGDASNWWIYGPTCVERMVRAAGFREAIFRGFIWKPSPGTRTPEGFLRQGRGVVVARR